MGLRESRIIFFFILMVPDLGCNFYILGLWVKRLRGLEDRDLEIIELLDPGLRKVSFCLSPPVDLGCKSCILSLGVKGLRDIGIMGPWGAGITRF